MKCPGLTSSVRLRVIKLPLKYDLQLQIVPIIVVLKILRKFSLKGL